MRAVLVLLALLVPVSETHAIEAEPEGDNCRLSAPPESAGEEFNHGIVLRVYPRARDIAQSYSGCQIMWAPDSEKWVTVSITQVVNGDPVRIWSPHAKSPELTACRY